MRVMCIKSGKWVHRSGRVSQDFDPQYGDICTVEREKTINSIRVYWLTGYVGMYNANFFIPLSDIDETEILAQREAEPQHA